MPERLWAIIIPINDGQKETLYKSLKKQYGEKILSMDYTGDFNPNVILRVKCDDIAETRRKIIEITHLHPTIYPISEEL